MGFSFNRTKREYLRILQGFSRSPWTPVIRNVLQPPGMAGGHHVSTKYEVRVERVPVEIKNHGFDSFERLKEDLAAWLITETACELVFDDEPDRIRYAMVEGSLDLDELIERGKGTITFICPDPYKYGPEKVAEFPSDGVTLNYAGTVETGPIFELEVLQPITFALIQNHLDQYQMIGRPVDVDTPPFVAEQLILHSTMATTNGWTAGSQVDNGSVEGSMISNGSRFLVQSFGNESEAKWHGPALKTSLSESLQDFRIDALIENLNGKEEVGKVEIYLLDVNNEIVGRITLKDAWQTFRRNRGEAKAGGANGHYLLDQNHEGAWNDFKGMLRLGRIGNQWLSYIAKIRPDGTHHARETRMFTDTANRYMDRVAQIQVHISKFGGFKHGQMAIDDLKVWKINHPGDFDIPYIAYPGDKITFNHKQNEDEILINGEDRTALKAFGAEYFQLLPGANQLIVEPSDSFQTSTKYRERFR
ncbi:phage tail family protein [Sutcliffiella horikoshii]|uniref:distal tail protein Dit n=1 Tax=Sutcliffiella horikoshii TaxID=79883 RepID=UPI00203CFB75|nr:phage tail family protein [Sutcliffiella horikoshii]